MHVVPTSLQGKPHEVVPLLRVVQHVLRGLGSRDLLVGRSAVCSSPTTSLRCFQFPE